MGQGDIVKTVKAVSGEGCSVCVSVMFSRPMSGEGGQVSGA